MCSARFPLSAPFRGGRGKRLKAIGSSVFLMCVASAGGVGAQPVSAVTAASDTGPAGASIALGNLIIEVLGSPPALDCPQMAAIRDALSKHRITLPDHPVALEIVFSHAHGETSAALTARGGRTGVRVLTIASPRCEALLEPLTVAMALLLDPDAQLQSTEAGPAPASPAIAVMAPVETNTPPTQTPGLPVASATPTSAPAPPPQKFSPLKDPGATPVPNASRGFGRFEKPVHPPAVQLSAGPAVSFGLTPTLALGGELDAGLQWRWLSLHFGAGTTLRSSVPRGAGRVAATVLKGSFSLCGERELGRGFAGAFCGVGAVARLAVEGEHYWKNGEAHPTFGLLGGLIELRYPSRPRSGWGVYIRTAWLVPVERQSFSISGVSGEAFRSASVSGWLGIGGWLKTL